MFNEVDHSCQLSLARRIVSLASCNIEYSIPTADVMQDAFDIENDRYGFVEEISDRAKKYLDDIEKKAKAAAKAAKAAAKK